MTQFFQDGPKLHNQFDDDRLLRSYLRRQFSESTYADLEPDLRRFGARVATDILEVARQAEAQPPRHIPYDAWGRRVDSIEVSAAWKALDRISASEGLVAIAYERSHGPQSRIDQFARIYLFHASSAYYTCPLAMTDGAARTLELHGDAELCAGTLRRLTTRDPEQFWTSGQWMTERAGGSDVSRTSTVAKWENGGYRLHGTKWFTSATTAQIALTLARTEGAPEGSRGLSLFYLELRDAEGRLQRIRVHRLKDKLGTRALPTAELTLEGTPARLVGSLGDGVRRIATLINITRVHNALCALATMRRGLALARDYARKRHVFGKPLASQPLHRETLAALEVEFQAAFFLGFRAAELLGREETGEATREESATLRLLTPLAKLYTARQAVSAISEIVEAFGGAGYVEDTGIPRLLRDVQVLPIWEGTTNVLSLDVLRALQKEAALGPFVAEIKRRTCAAQTPELLPASQHVRQEAARIVDYLERARAEPAEILTAGARSLAFSLARTYAASLLIDHAAWSVEHERSRHTLVAAHRWCAQALATLHWPEESHRCDSQMLAMDEDAPLS